MKILLIFLILVYQNRYIDCISPVYVLESKINYFVNSVISTFRDISEKVQTFFNTSLVKRKGHESKLKIQDKYKINSTKCAFGEKLNKGLLPSFDKLYLKKLREEITALMSTEQLILSHNRGVEVHSVTTKDGYVLILHRVICPIKQNISTQGMVLLHHGLLGSSADWILLGEEKSLPYLLCDAGYDVWLANARGNRYSRKHLTLSPSSEQFWNYTWQEIGLYDLPAAIDYLRKVDNKTKRINYIGHSLGATALLVLLAEHPDYNNYLRLGVLLAPLALMADVKGPLRVIGSAVMKSPNIVYDVLGKGEFLPDRRVPAFLVKKVCKKSKVFCSNPLYFLAGKLVKESDYKDPAFLSRLLYQVPAGGSTKTILHYAQIVKCGKFHAYNDSKKEYPLKNVTLPIALFSSNEDWLSVVADVTRLYVSIANPIEHNILMDKNISHTEFVWGLNANTVIFNKILKILENSPRNATNLNEV